MPISFTPLSRSDFPLLLKWLEAPHVKAWWDTDMRWTSKLVQEKFGAYVHGYKWIGRDKNPLQAYIIYEAGCPIGYIQFYNAYDFPREDNVPLDGLPDPLAALDFFIGEEDALGKGMGVQILKKFLKVYVSPMFDACFVDPESSNTPALRTYEKAGFKRVREVKTCTWMLWERLS